VKMPRLRSRSRPAVAALGFALALAGLASSAFAADPKVLNVYNWSDYIADDTLKNF
jgi:putrescine transport system substrate-binding protein